MDRFFHLVWRANALVIFAVGLGALVLVGFLLFEVLGDAFRPKRVSNVVQLADDTIESESLALGHFKTIAGSPWLSASFHSTQQFALGSTSKQSGSTRNYYFYEPETGSAHWLLPDHDRLIEGRIALPPSARRRDQPTEVRAVLWRVIAEDTNADGQLTGSDRATVYLSPPEGRPLRAILEDVDDLKGTNAIADDRISVMFLRDARLRAATIDLDTLSVVSDVEVTTLAASNR